jgi:hypothetical protein
VVVAGGVVGHPGILRYASARYLGRGHRHLQGLRRLGLVMLVGFIASALSASLVVEGARHALVGANQSRDDVDL